MPVWLVLVALLLQWVPETARAQEAGRRLTFVTVESAIENYLQSVGRLEARRKDAISHMAPLSWVASNISSGKETLEQWKQDHPFGGMIRLVVSWKVEPSSRTLQTMEEQRGAPLTAEQLFKLTHVTTASNYSLRLTGRGWMMRDPDTADVGSTVFPYSRNHPSGFHLPAIDYITTVNGSVVVQNMQARLEEHALEFQTLEPWDIVNTGRDGLAEFKWGRCGIARLAESSTFHVFAEEPVGSGNSAGRLESGRFWFRCHGTARQTYTLDCGRLQLRFADAEFALTQTENRAGLQVYRGEVWVIDGREEKHVEAGIGYTAEGGLAKNASNDRPDWAADARFEFNMPLIDGKFNYCSHDAVRTNLYGMLDGNPDQEHFVVDGKLDTAVKFGGFRKRKEAVIALPDHCKIDEIRVYAGSGSNEVVTTEYTLEVSQDGMFRGEEVIVRKGFYGGIETIGRPNHKRRIDISPQVVRFIRYRVTNDNDVNSTLYEIQALGSKPVHPYESLRHPWAFAVNLLAGGREATVATTRKQTDKTSPDLVLDGRIDGGKVTVEGDGGAVRVDFGKDVACNGLSLSARILSERSGRTDQTFAVQVSPNGRFRGEQKRLVVSSIPLATRPLQVTLAFEPTLARYWQVEFVNGVNQNVAVYDVEMLAPAYTENKRGEAVAFTATTPFTGNESLLVSGPVGALHVAQVECSDTSAKIDAALDGDLRSGVDILGKSSAVTMKFENRRMVHSIGVYASPMSTTAKEVTNFVLESSETGDFQGEERILATGVFEGVGSADSFDYYQKFNLNQPTAMLSLRLRVTYESGEGYRLHEVAIEGVSD